MVPDPVQKSILGMVCEIPIVHLSQFRLGLRNRDGRPLCDHSQVALGHYGGNLDDGVLFRFKTGHLEVHPDQSLLDHVSGAGGTALGLLIGGEYHNARTTRMDNERCRLHRVAEKELLVPPPVHCERNLVHWRLVHRNRPLHPRWRGHR